TRSGVRREYASDGVLFELALFGEARSLFQAQVGFLDEKQSRLAKVKTSNHRPSDFSDSLISKEPVGDRDVYDFTESSSHSCVGNGVILRNCGEQPLLPYESCNLGSIDLARHVKRSAAGRWDVDWKKLEGTIRATTRMLDDVIDMNAYPVKEIEEMTHATRKIGLGVMGFARMLFMLEVPYDSKEGVQWGRKIMQFIQETGYNESAKLAEERGVYPAWEGSRHQEKGLRLRNSYVTTVAKTINLPREATVEDVKKAYLLAFDLHGKGITVYRDGSRGDQVLNIGVAETDKPKQIHVEVPPEPAVVRPRARPDVITGRTQKILTGYGALYVTVNEDEKGLFEVFAQIGRGGGYTASFT